MAILLIEDDPAVQELVSTLLSSANFNVDIAADGAAGHRLATTGKYEVVILDLGLPDMDGLDLLRRLRAEGITTHVLILTSKDGPEDRVIGLDTGADDYLSKPCVLPELEARVRALLRRKYNAKNPIVTVDDLQINSATRSASRGGKHIPLTPREYALLEFLARKAGQLVTRAEIWENLYAMDSNTTSNVVDVYIGYLRKKLDVPGKPPLIHTRRGSGFILGIQG
jgi:two-component system copper resistance phosphate regulon response regulator CusR